MEGVALVYLNNYKLSWEFNPSSKFYSYLSQNNNTDAPGTHSHMMNLYQNLIDEYIIQENDSTVWGEIYCRLKQYRCALPVYLITII